MERDATSHVASTGVEEPDESEQVTIVAAENRMLHVKDVRLPLKLAQKPPIPLL